MRGPSGVWVAGLEGDSFAHRREEMKAKGERSIFKGWWTLAGGTAGIVAVVGILAWLAGVSCALVCLVADAGGCASVPVAEGDLRRELCTPTGWVDRIEGDLAVVNPDGGDEEEVYPITCFPEAVRPGTRLVNGRVDVTETQRVSQEINAILKRLAGRGEEQYAGSPPMQSPCLCFGAPARVEREGNCPGLEDSPGRGALRSCGSKDDER